MKKQLKITSETVMTIAKKNVLRVRKVEKGAVQGYIYVVEACSIFFWVAVRYIHSR